MSNPVTAAGPVTALGILQSQSVGEPADSLELEASKEKYKKILVKRLDLSAATVASTIKAAPKKPESGAATSPLNRPVTARTRQAIQEKTEKEAADKGDKSRLVVEKELELTVDGGARHKPSSRFPGAVRKVIGKDDHDSLAEHAGLVPKGTQAKRQGIFLGQQKA